MHTVALQKPQQVQALTDFVPFAFWHGKAEDGLRYLASKILSWLVHLERVADVVLRIPTKAPFFDNCRRKQHCCFAIRRDGLSIKLMLRSGVQTDVSDVGQCRIPLAMQACCGCGLAANNYFWLLSHGAHMANSLSWDKICEVHL